MDDSVDERIYLPAYIMYAATPGLVESMVSGVLSACTAQEIAMIGKALIPGAEPEDMSACQFGGQIGNLEGGHLALYEFMTLADSIHDFGRTFPLPDIRDWCPAPLMTVFSKVHGKEEEGRKMRQIDLMEIKREDVLLTHLTRPKQLRFPGHAPIDNPFLNKNVMKRYPYDKNKSILAQARCARQGVRLQGSRVVSMEVWLEEPQPRWLQLEQIAKVCTTIKAALGSEVEWIVDASHEALPSLVTSFPIIHEQLLQRFKTTTPDFADALRTTVAAKWTPVMCDATFCDAGDDDRHVYEESERTMGFDPSRTGQVYRDGYPHQVTLEGAEHRRDNDFYYTIAEKGVLNARHKDHSLGAMRAAIKLILKQVSEDVISNEYAMEEISKALAYKRAGDWGQVENCVLNGRALMTCDKMAAMYAIMRGVSVVYMAHAQHGDVLQMTFTMVKGSVSTDKSQSGGSKTLKKKAPRVKRAKNKSRS